MRHRIILAAFCALALVAHPLSAQGKWHKDEQRGFQVKPPAGWTQIPIATSQEWIVAKYLSNREYRDKKEGYTHRPEFQVILFPDAVTKQRGAKVTRKGNKLLLRVKNPYRNFDAYMKATASGGYYLLDDKDATINGIKVSCRRYKFEKLTAQRIGYAWIFEGRDAKWVLYGEALESHVKKLEMLFKKSFKTFKFIQRRGSITQGGTTGSGLVEIDTADGNSKESPEEIFRKREARFDREVRRASAALPSGWRVQKSRNFVALTHVDKKYTTKVLKRAEAIRKWLEKEFSFLEGPKAGRTIIRICRDQAEESSFSRTGGGFRMDDFEIVTHKPMGQDSWESGWINRSIVSNWFRARNRNLAWGMPTWLSSGLSTVLGQAEIKGNRIKLKPSVWEKTSMRELAREDKIARPREFMTLSWKEFNRIEHATSQSGTFVRFLLAGPRSRVKGVLEAYMKAIIEVAAEEEAKAKAEREKERAASNRELTEEEQEAEEERRFRERNSKKDDRLKRVFERAFKDWSESRWKKFESSYAGFAG